MIDQEQLEDLKKRIENLEAAEVKLRIRSTGPRGPIGPAGPHGESIVGPKGDRGEKGEEGRDGRDGVTPSRQDLENLILGLLSEYHLLDENSCPYSGPYAAKEKK
jgi:hypothetical protein